MQNIRNIQRPKNWQRHAGALEHASEEVDRAIKIIEGESVPNPWELDESYTALI